MSLVLAPSSHSKQISISSLCPSVKCCWAARTAGAQPVCRLQVGPRERAHISPSSWLIKTFSCPPLLPQPHTAAHTMLITPIKLWFTVFTPSSCPHCGYRECEECPSPACPQCSQHPVKCEPINGGGGGGEVGCQATEHIFPLAAFPVVALITVQC